MGYNDFGGYNNNGYNNNNYNNRSNYNNNNNRSGYNGRGRSRRDRDDDSFRFVLAEHIGVLSSRDSGWTKEVNLIEWNGQAAKVDVRDWSPDHERMSRGITLTEREARNLAIVLAKRYGAGTTAGMYNAGRQRSENAEAPAGAGQGMNPETFTGTAALEDAGAFEDTVPFEDIDTFAAEEISAEGGEAIETSA